MLRLSVNHWRPNSRRVSGPSLLGLSQDPCRGLHRTSEEPLLLKVRSRSGPSVWNPPRPPTTGVIDECVPLNVPCKEYVEILKVSIMWSKRWIFNFFSCFVFTLVFCLPSSHLFHSTFFLGVRLSWEVDLFYQRCKTFHFVSVMLRVILWKEISFIRTYNVNYVPKIRRILFQKTVLLYQDMFIFGIWAVKFLVRKMRFRL